MTNAELAILSLVSEQPRHGYDIERVIEERGMREWTEVGFSSIYYILNKFEKAGLIESQLQQSQGKGPARKVYRITQQGRNVQSEASLKTLENPQRTYTPFLIGLSNLPTIPQETALEALRTYAAQLENRLAHLLRRMEEQSPLPFYVEAMFDYSRTLIQAELDWMDDFIKKIGGTKCQK